MSLRQKLLLVMSLTVVLAVAAVAWIVSLRTRQAFAEADRKHTAAIVEQFQHEFQAHADDVAARVTRVAESDRLARMAVELSRPGGDAAGYVNEAAALAHDYELDFLEVLAADGSIVSSAQWPARFGYKEDAFVAGGPSFASIPIRAILRREPLPDGSSAIGVFALRQVRDSIGPSLVQKMGEGGAPKNALYVIGGRRLDRAFLANLATPADTTILLYPVLSASFDPQQLVSSTGEPAEAARYQPLIEQAGASKKPVEGVIYLTNRREDSVDATAVPLAAPDGSVLAVVLVANSRRGFVELQQHIRAIAYGVAGTGILLAIAVSLWISSRISRPVEQLATAAGEVAAGNWHAHVEVASRDEVGALAESFNHMTQQLLEQRERLIQSERVAAWRELARRLAHELKNPLFPLQLTVENLIRARSNLPPEQFEEIFQESTSTLTAEIANLKNIVARFSDFSKMPMRQFQPVDIREIVRKVATLYGPALGQHQPPIALQYELSGQPLPVTADAELLHRAISNLVLNAMDAMPQGGTLTLAAAAKDDVVQVRVSDTGSGMTSEECERLFTPYYTTKQHGTGLGLAIVQSIVSDHGGTIRVESMPGTGTTLVIEVPVERTHPSNRSLGGAAAVGPILSPPGGEKGGAPGPTIPTPEDSPAKAAQP